MGFLLDPLSMVMALFITGVSSLVFLYAIGYMHGDRDYSKFFLYLCLFAFSMLMLVLGSSLLVTFLGWEGVGACSYWLISFWFTSDSNASECTPGFVSGGSSNSAGKRSCCTVCVGMISTPVMSRAGAFS